MVKPEEIVNFRALSRYLTGKDTNIHSGNIPKKYTYKVRLLFFFIEIWMKAIQLDDKPIKLD
jgi:hypothetical protein